MGGIGMKTYRIYSEEFIEADSEDEATEASYEMRSGQYNTEEITEEMLLLYKKIWQLQEESK